MNKSLIIAILVIFGIIGLIGLIVGAILSLMEALVGFILWSIIIAIIYFTWKAKT